MLNELYNYAQNHELISKPGFKFKKIKAFISLGKNGNFLSIEPASDEFAYFCPDIATNGTFSNILAEKAEIVFGIPLDEGDSPKKINTRLQKIEFFLPTEMPSPRRLRNFIGSNTRTAMSSVSK